MLWNFGSSTMIQYRNVTLCVLFYDHSNNTCVHLTGRLLLDLFDSEFENFWFIELPVFAKISFELPIRTPSIRIGALKSASLTLSNIVLYTFCSYDLTDRLSVGKFSIFLFFAIKRTSRTDDDRCEKIVNFFFSFLVSYSFVRRPANSVSYSVTQSTKYWNDLKKSVKR